MMYIKNFVGLTFMAFCIGCSVEEQDADVDFVLKRMIPALSHSLTNGFDVLVFDREVKKAVPIICDRRNAERYINFYEKSILSTPIFTPDCTRDINLLYVRFNGLIDVLKHLSCAVSEAQITCENRLTLVFNIASHLENEAKRMRHYAEAHDTNGTMQIIARSVAKNVMTYRDGWLSLHIDTGVWLESYIETLSQDEVRDVMRRIEKSIGRCPMWCKSRW